jgi:hypothetical protein
MGPLGGTGSEIDVPEESASANPGTWALWSVQGLRRAYRGF